MEIEKKTWPELFQRMLDGEKTTDLRLADFEINEGDIMVLKEYDPDKKEYTGRELRKKVKNLNKLNLTKFHEPKEMEEFGHWVIELGGMEIGEINDFIDNEIKRIEKYYGDKDQNEITMAMGFKVIEEIGELFKEFLSKKGYQRKDKLEHWNEENLKKEFADVIITVLIMARKFDVDIEDAIKIKMDEIKKRNY